MTSNELDRQELSSQINGERKKELAALVGLPRNSTTHFLGIIQQANRASWLIDGFEIQKTDTTVLIGQPKVGDEVLVKVLISRSEPLKALEIEVTHPLALPVVDNQDEAVWVTPVPLWETARPLPLRTVVPTEFHTVVPTQWLDESMESLKETYLPTELWPFPTEWPVDPGIYSTYIPDYVKMTRMPGEWMPDLPDLPDLEDLPDFDFPW